MKNNAKPKETDELKKRIGELENQLKRALADYQNLEKRVAAERSEWIKTVNKELILRILPILDTLKMAAKHSQDDTLQVSIKQFEDVLKSAGATGIDTIGRMFDPLIMDAVATGDGEEGKILEEVRPGYMLHDKVLRVAQVKVGKSVS